MTPYNQPGHFLIKTGPNTYTENIWVNLEGSHEMGTITQSSIQDSNGDWYHLITLRVIFNGTSDPFAQTWNESFDLTFQTKFTGVRIDLYNLNGTLYRTSIDRLEDAYAE